MNRNLVRCALFAAATAVLAQIALPIGAVPVSLATLGALLAGAVLGPKYGALSQAVYLALGAFGAPVFAAFHGGVEVLIGPRGGFLLGYVAMAFIAGALSVRAGRPMAFLPGLILGTFVCLALGMLWYMAAVGAGVIAALSTCVLPFLLGDGLKLLMVMSLAPRLKTALYSNPVGI